MGNKSSKAEVPKLYNKDFVNKESQNKKGKQREIVQDTSPKSYSLPIQLSDDSICIKIVSWNVNMEAHSSYASNEWIDNNDKWQLVYDKCQEQDPDIICFQEISKPFYGKNSANNQSIHPLIQMYIDTNDWCITKSYASHCGYMINLVHMRLEAKGFDIDVSDQIDPLQKFPAIVLNKHNIEEQKDENKQNEEESSTKLILFGTHLHPFGGDHNASKRREQFDRLYNISAQKGLSDYFVLCGDTNMRYNEEMSILEDFKGKLNCCWNIVPEEYKKNCMYTWYRNFFEVGAEGCSRYDKFFYGPKIECVEVSVFDDVVSDDKYHFLSDHRAIAVKLIIK